MRDATRCLVLCMLAALMTQRVAGMQPEDKLPPAGTGQVWKLAWNDEFDGKKLDETKWDVPEFERRDAFWTRKAIALDSAKPAAYYHLSRALLAQGHVGGIEERDGSSQTEAAAEAAREDPGARR